MTYHFKYDYNQDNGEIRIMGALQSMGKKKGPSTGVGGHYQRLVLEYLNVLLIRIRFFLISCCFHVVDKYNMRGKISIYYINHMYEF
jgi:hypothetical protein